MDPVADAARHELEALRHAAARARRLLEHHHDPDYLAHPSHPNRLRAAADDMQRALGALLDDWGRSWLDHQHHTVRTEVERYRVLRQSVLMAAVSAGSDLQTRDFPDDPEFHRG